MYNGFQTLGGVLQWLVSAKHMNKVQISQKCKLKLESTITKAKSIAKL